jgi:antitoxin component YwqK of YwqJK toxin-antitoxin module
MSSPAIVLLLSLSLCFASALPMIPPLGAQSAAPGATAARYYLSNELGMAFEEIGWYRRDESTFVLEVRADGGTEVRILYQDGAPIKRWERSDRRRRVYENGELTETELFDDKGRRVELREFDKGSLARRTEFSYAIQGQIRATTFDAEGNLLYTDRSMLFPDRSLREVRREYSGGGRSKLSLSMTGGGLVEEEIAGNGLALIKHYDSRGRLAAQERWAEAELQEREILRYRDEEQLPVTAVTEDFVAGRISKRAFDVEGRLEGIEVEQDGRIVEEIRYERDAEGRAVSTTRRGPLGLEQWRAAYGEDGELIREEYRRRGALERVTLHEGEGRVVEELYRGGELFLRVTYVDDEKIREEFLTNGVVVRTREYR